MIFKIFCFSVDEVCRIPLYDDSLEHILQQHALVDVNHSYTQRA